MGADGRPLPRQWVRRARGERGGGLLGGWGGGNVGVMLRGVPRQNIHVPPMVAPEDPKIPNGGPRGPQKYPTVAPEDLRVTPNLPRLAPKYPRPPNGGTGGPQNTQWWHWRTPKYPTVAPEDPKIPNGGTGGPQNIHVPQWCHWRTPKYPMVAPEDLRVTQIPHIWPQNVDVPLMVAPEDPKIPNGGTGGPQNTQRWPRRTSG